MHHVIASCLINVCSLSNYFELKNIYILILNTPIHVLEVGNCFYQISDFGLKVFGFKTQKLFGFVFKQKKKRETKTRRVPSLTGPSPLNI